MTGPFAIGGCGGSGTRVVAEILGRMGVFMGRELNAALDNLWFTSLFKRPAWYRRNRGNAGEFRLKCELFEKAMTGSGPLSAEESAILNEYSTNRARRMEKRGLAWAPRRFIGPAPGGNGRFAAWGWKEPNTHIFIEELAANFREMKYVHVIRHGLDMALSSNQRQIGNWGWLFDLEEPAFGEQAPLVALDYWIRANRRAVDVGARLLGERFILLSYDRLCASPALEIERLKNFLGIEVDASLMDGLSAVPRVSESSGRYKRRLSIFDKERMDAVRAFGFEI